MLGWVGGEFTLIMKRIAISVELTDYLFFFFLCHLQPFVISFLSPFLTFSFPLLLGRPSGVLPQVVSTLLNLLLVVEVMMCPAYARTAFVGM